MVGGGGQGIPTTHRQAPYPPGTDPTAPRRDFSKISTRRSGTGIPDWTTSSSHLGQVYPTPDRDEHGRCLFLHFGSAGDAFYTHQTWWRRWAFIPGHLRLGFLPTYLLPSPTLDMGRRATRLNLPTYLTLFFVWTVRLWVVEFPPWPCYQFGPPQVGLSTHPTHYLAGPLPTLLPIAHTQFAFSHHSP